MTNGLCQVKDCGRTAVVVVEVTGHDRHSPFSRWALCRDHQDRFHDLDYDLTNGALLDTKAPSKKEA